MSETSEKSPMSLKNILLVVSALVVVVAVIAAVYFYQQYTQAQFLLKNPTLVAQQQTNQLVDQVGKLIELPKNEQPTIATVSDVSKLQDQPFFQNAQNDDKVLIYTKAREAILYRPSDNKIIAVAPVNLGTTQQVSPTPVVPKVTARPTVAPSSAQ